MTRRTSILVALLLLAMGCSKPKAYHALKVDQPVIVDGRSNEVVWSQAPWSDPFVDIEGARKPQPRMITRMKMMWDDQYLYIAAEMEEPHVWGSLTEHDSIVYHDNDFEVFIDPDGDTRNYFEIEINVLGTIFDLLLIRTYRNGGPAWHGWDAQGMLSAVHVEGTVNDPSDLDMGWMVELAIPWTLLADMAGARVPPEVGDTWRINFSRVQWRHQIVGGAYEKIPDTPEDNWVWTPQGEINMHVPEKWGYVTFVE
jgi:hypothetical protein